MPAMEEPLSTDLRFPACASRSFHPPSAPICPDEKGTIPSTTPGSYQPSNGPASPAAPHRGDTSVTESDYAPASPCSVSSIATSHLSPSQAFGFSPTAPLEPLSPGPPVPYGHEAVLCPSEHPSNSQLDLGPEGVTHDENTAEPHPISYLTGEQLMLHRGDLRRKRPQPDAMESHKLPRINRTCDFDIFRTAAPRQETGPSRKGKTPGAPRCVLPGPEIESGPGLLEPIAAARNTPGISIFIAGGTPAPLPAAFNFWQSRPPRHRQGSSPPRNQPSSHHASATAPTSHAEPPTGRYVFNETVPRSSPTSSSPTAAPDTHWHGSNYGEGGNSSSDPGQFQPSVDTNANPLLAPDIEGTTTLAIEAWVSDASEDDSMIWGRDDSSPQPEVTASSSPLLPPARCIHLPNHSRPRHSPSPEIDPLSSPPAMMYPQSPRTRERRSPSMPWSRPPWNWGPPPP